MAVGFRRRLALTIIAILFLIPLLAYRAINSVYYQRRALTFISEHSPWEVSASNIHWSFWDSRISIQDLRVHQRTTLHDITADSFSVQYNAWLIFAAQLGIRDIQGHNVEVDLSHVIPNKNPERLDWSRILLLRNLRIGNAQLRQIHVILPDTKEITADDLTLSFLPNFLRQIKLTVDVNNVTYSQHKMDRFFLQGMTNVSNWKDTAPYVDDIEGVLKLDEVVWGSNILNYLRSEVDYKEKRIEWNSLDALVNGRSLTGSGMVDFVKEKYAVKLAIPEPIEIKEPKIDFPPEISMAGTIEGSLQIQGDHFDRQTSTGSFAVDLTQTPKSIATKVPIRLSSKGKWAKGVVQLEPSTVKIADGVITLNGKIDLIAPNLNIPFTLHNVPVAPVFGRFNDENFHPISGFATGQGTMKGWGPSFVVEGSNDVLNVSYVPIVIEKAHVTVKATTSKLMLNGDVYQRGKTVGHCDMAIQFDQSSRPGLSKIELKANLDHLDLAQPMKEFEFTGIATANYEIRGVTSRIQANGKATVENGNFRGLPFKKASTVMHMGNRDLHFDSAEIDIPNLQHISFTQPINMKMSPGQFAFDGHPHPQLSLKGSYHYASRLWKVDDISFVDSQHPEWRVSISGSSANSNLNLRVRGVANADLLTTIRDTFRDVTGPVRLDVQLRGPTTNPAIVGTALLDNNTFLLRNSPYRAENIQGTLRLNGHEAKLDGVAGNIEDGRFTVSGNVHWDRWRFGNFNLHFLGNAIRYAALGGPLRLELDTDLVWVGSPEKSHLSGMLNVEDGLYTQNFNIIDQFKASAPLLPDAGSINFDNTVSLNLRVRNAGEIRVRNNVADLTLQTNMTLMGTLAKPTMSGTIQTEDGNLNYFGLRFVIARGIVEFRDRIDNPYIEFVGEREVFSAGDQNYLVTLTMKGPTNNLNFDLSSNPPQDRANLISLLTVGATQDEIRNRQFSGPSTSQMVAGQVGSAFLQPVSSFIHLDSVQYTSGSANPYATTQNSRLSLGKRLSERANLSFATDVGGTNPQQSLMGEYQLTDFLLIKGGQTSNQNFGLNLILRFRER